MVYKQFTPENAEKNFIYAKQLTEIILFLILALQLFEDFFENICFPQFTIILSHVGVVICLLGMLCKYMSSMHSGRIEHDQAELVSFYDSFLGSILIPMILLYDVDDVIFKATTISNLELVKHIILIAAFISAVFSRFILYLADKFSKRTSLDASYMKSKFGIDHGEIIAILNYLNSIINFLLCLAFWYLSICMKWKDDLWGEAVMSISLALIICTVIPFYYEDRKRLYLTIAIIGTIGVCAYYTYMFMR